ncbi:MAG: hypothetical protein COV45_03405 [Deltaproteobacteria bacterium CG11_big_fil_rev_8_21_14_0_20_47_16]|nr:MAG: hypothetical protein COV45_03405 [Deltaproteobacteria bacterium CG11_big_fil_rev_8_21_14_0_20_47_16]
MDKLEDNLLPQDICRTAFESMASKQFDEAEKLLGYHMSQTEDPVALGLYHSAMGVAAKMQGKFKEAWRHYDRAEKLIPTDPALKLISARLMIDQFHEFDTAIKKAKKVLEIIPNNRAMVHQARTIMGLAYAKQGKKAKACDCLRDSIVEQFQGFVTTDNINFRLVEEVARKGWDQNLCRTFIETALRCAQEHNENLWCNKLQKILDAMPTA